MPQEVQSGAAVVFGIGSSGGAIEVGGNAFFILDMAKGVHKFKLDAIEDENGYDVSLIATNQHIELDITFVPSGRAGSAGGTRADAYASAVFLEPLSRVSLLHFRVAAFNGDYVYVGDESIDLTHKEAKMSLKIRKYSDATQNALLTTTVSDDK